MVSNDENKPGGTYSDQIENVMGAVSSRGSPDDSGNSTVQAGKNVALLVYILQAVSFLFLVTSLVGVIVNYVKRSEVRGSWVESHFRWQIRTFWFALLWSIIGAMLTVVYIGFLILFANVIWFIYRIVRGWLNLNDNRAMYQS